MNIVLVYWVAAHGAESGYIGRILANPAAFVAAYLSRGSCGSAALRHGLTAVCAESAGVHCAAAAAPLTCRCSAGLRGGISHRSGIAVCGLLTVAGAAVHGLLSVSRAALHGLLAVAGSASESGLSVAALI